MEYKPYQYFFNKLVWKKQIITKTKIYGNEMHVK